MGPTERVSRFLEIQTEGKGPQNKQELDMAAVAAWQSARQTSADIHGSHTDRGSEDLEPSKIKTDI